MEKLLEATILKLKERGVSSDKIRLLEDENHLLSSASTLLAGTIERYVLKKLPKHLVVIDLKTNSGIQKVGLIKINTSKTLFEFEKVLRETYKLADEKVLKRLVKQKQEYLIEHDLTPIFSLEKTVIGKYDQEYFLRVSRSHSKFNIKYSLKIFPTGYILSKGIGYVVVMI